MIFFLFFVKNALGVFFIIRQRLRNKSKWMKINDVKGLLFKFSINIDRVV